MMDQGNYDTLLLFFKTLSNQERLKTPTDNKIGQCFHASSLWRPAVRYRGVRCAHPV